MNTLPSKIHNYNNGLDYTLVGDYYLPDFMPFEALPLSKYGRMRLRYLKKHRPCTYTALLLSGKLYDDLHDADETAQRMVPSSIMRKFIYKSGRTQSAQGRETCP